MPEVCMPSRPPRSKPEPMPEGFIEALTLQISEVLQEKGISPHRLAKLASIDPPAIHRFLKGGSSVSLTTLARILDALGLRIKLEAKPENPQ